MVTYNGEIPQAYGPRNCQNKASKWGSRVLRRWGMPLKEVQLSLIPTRMDDDVMDDEVMDDDVMDGDIPF